MSNPILQPDDRHRRKPVLDDEGRNPFADAEQPGPSPDVSNDFAAPDSAGQPAYRPQYAPHLPARGRFIATVGTVGFILTWMLLLIFVAYPITGLLACMLGVLMCLAAAMLGYQELDGISKGAIDSSGTNLTQLGFYLGLGGVVIGLGAIFAVIAAAIQGMLELY